MAWCLMAPSHYLNQCWLIIYKAQWHTSLGNFKGDTPISYKSPRGQWVNGFNQELVVFWVIVWRSGEYMTLKQFIVSLKYILATLRPIQWRWWYSWYCTSLTFENELFDVFRMTILLWWKHQTIASIGTGVFIVVSNSTESWPWWRHMAS